MHDINARNPPCYKNHFSRKAGWAYGKQTHTTCNGMCECESKLQASLLSSFPQTIIVSSHSWWKRLHMISLVFSFFVINEPVLPQMRDELYQTTNEAIMTSG